MKLQFYHGWRWKRFDLGFGIEYHNILEWGIDIWLMIGFYYCGVEIYGR